MSNTNTQDTSTSQTPAALANPPVGYNWKFIETAESSSAKPISHIIAQEQNCSGVLQEVRWASHGADGYWSTFIHVIIDDRPAKTFALTHSIQDKPRDVGSIFNNGSYYSLPLGSGVKFNKNFQVIVSGVVSPDISHPSVPQSGAGYVKRIGVAYTIF